MTEIRSHVANRLRRESERRGFSVAQIASASGYSEETISAYLRGDKEIDFRETQAICTALAINPVRLFLRDYPETRIRFRGATTAARQAAATIEEAFLTVRHLLPRAVVPSVSRPDDGHEDIGWLIGTLVPCISEIRKQYPSAEGFFAACQIPVIPVRANDQFDAFLLSSGDRVAICVNRDKPSARVHFSLLHEMAHALYHRDTEIPIDVLENNLYLERISRDSIPEFIAYKFAQFFMLPFDEVRRLVARWPNLDVDQARQMVSSGRASLDVLTNALFDVLRLGSRPVLYAAVRDRVRVVLGSSSQDLFSVTDYLDQQRSALRDMILAGKDDFSEEVFRRVREGLQLD